MMYRGISALGALAPLCLAATAWGAAAIVTPVAAQPVQPAARSRLVPDAETFRTFVTNVICRPHLAYLPDAAKDAFIDHLTQLAANDEPRFELDYWRLNLSARRARRGVHRRH